MAKSKGPIPEGFHTVTPYLVMPGIAGLMEFLKQAFDGQEQERMARPDGYRDYDTDNPWHLPEFRFKAVFS